MPSALRSAPLWSSLLGALLLACPAPKPSGCGPDAPCPAGQECQAGGCAAVVAAPAQVTTAPPALRGATVLAGSGGSGPRVRVLGTAPGAARVQVFLDAACAGVEAASGTSEQLTAPGLDVAVPAGAKAIELRAVATGAAGRSACSAPLKMELRGLEAAADSWRAAGFASLAATRVEWEKLTKAQQSLGAALPAELRGALAKAGLAPIAQLGRLRGNHEALLSADLDGDGARDHALVVVPSASRLGAALVAALDRDGTAPSDAELGPLLAELRRISLDGGSEVAVAIRRGAGFVWTRRPGNGFASLGLWKAPDLCNPSAAALADLAALQARHANAVEYLVGESAGSGYLVWDAKSAKIADLPDLCQ